MDDRISLAIFHQGINMTSPFWLPPLNSHGNYTTTVEVSQSQAPTVDLESREKNFLLHFYVDVSFSSKSKQTLEGLSVRDDFLVPCCFMICSSPEEVKKIVSDILCHMHVPFQLDDHEVLFTHKDLNKESKRLKRQYNFHKDANNWVAKFQESLNIMTHQRDNAGHNVLPVDLRIKKQILISPNEFEAWLSWFQEKERVDPSFREAYGKAVTRPRTVEELLDAENLKLKRVNKSSLTGLEKASFDDDNSTSTAQCMVCLEEFSTGSEVCRLPCSHIFHKACVTEWLQQSNMCPLCRCALPSD